MEINNALQSLLRQSKSNENIALRLKAGQIFEGKILKQFGNQMAIVQFGGHKITARIEVPSLATNERYWFQVQENTSSLELKVLQNGDGKNPGILQFGEENTSEILKRMGIQVTKENQDFLKDLIKNNIPFTKENVEKASNLLNELKNDPQFKNNQQTFEVLKTLIKRDLPITNEVFKAIFSLNDKEALSSQLKSLNTLLGDIKSPSNVISQLKQTIASILNTFSNTEGLKESSQLQTTNQMKFVDAKNVLMQLFANLSNMPQNSNEYKVITSMLEKFGINLNQGLSDAKLQELSKQLSVPKEMLNKDVKNLINQLLVLIDKTQKPDQKVNILESFMKTLNPSVDSNKVYENLNQHEKMPQLTKQEADYISRLIENVKTQNEFTRNASTSSDDVSKAFKRIISMLGVQFEKDLLKLNNQNSEQVKGTLDSLKPLLMKALHEQLPQMLSDKMEHILNRITGQQLMSSELSGPIQQILLQLPMQLGNHFTDLSIQWNGKKKNNGEIDPNYCRIIFYLNLENLSDTVIDVNVQNRVINIQIMNNTPGIKRMAFIFEPLLKEKLASLNYKLSSIKIIDEEPPETEEFTPIIFQNANGIDLPYIGVDFRV